MPRRTWYAGCMRRVVILGRGGAGKSTLAARLGNALGLPVIELDRHFWAPDLTPTPKDRWARIQRRLSSGQAWVIDGDLGPYDVLDVRLRAADTVIVLDFPSGAAPGARCAAPARTWPSGDGSSPTGAAACPRSWPPSPPTPATHNSTCCAGPAPSNDSSPRPPQRPAGRSPRRALIAGIPRYGRSAAGIVHPGTDNGLAHLRQVAAGEAAGALRGRGHDGRVYLARHVGPTGCAVLIGRVVQ